MTRKEYYKWAAVRKATRLLEKNGYTVTKKLRPESRSAELTEKDHLKTEWWNHLYHHDKRQMVSR